MPFGLEPSDGLRAPSTVEVLRAERLTALSPSTPLGTLSVSKGLPKGCQGKNAELNKQ